MVPTGCRKQEGNTEPGKAQLLAFQPRDGSGALPGDCGRNGDQGRKGPVPGAGTGEPGTGQKSLKTGCMCQLQRAGSIYGQKMMKSKMGE